jgi:hypothetical protein
MKITTNNYQSTINLSPFSIPLFEYHLHQQPALVCFLTNLQDKWLKETFLHFDVTKFSLSIKIRIYFVPQSMKWRDGDSKIRK